MKTKMFMLTTLIMLVISYYGYAQLTGIKNIPGDYATVEQAIAALNSNGAGPGGVTFNVAAGYTESFTSFTSGLITTSTGSASSPIVFRKNGTGANPLITAYSISSGTTDYIICLAGTDYVTFDGIDLQETSGAVEWGIAILKSSGTNGSGNTTIRNSSITLNMTNTESTGIYAANHTPSSTTQLTVTALSGANSGLKVYNMNILNCYRGIYLSGYNDLASPYQYYDQNNEIGKDGANTINHVGGANITAYGIYAANQNNLKVSNNSITSSMGGSGTHYGIYLTSAKNASYDLNNNYVSMQFTGGGTAPFYPIYCDMGANGTSNTVNVYNNTVTNCTFPTLTTANISYMYLENLGVNASIHDNIINYNTAGSTSTTATGRIYYLYCRKTSNIMGPVDFYNNDISGNSRIQSIPGGGQTHFAAITGTGSLLNAYGNTVTNNIVASNGGTYLLNISLDIAERNTYNNTISNITKAEGTVYGLYSYNITANSGTGKFYQNKVQNISGTGTANYVSGIYNSAQGSVQYFYNNMVGDLRASGASYNYPSVVGLYANQGTAVFSYNTVYLNATSTGTNFSSSAVYAPSSSAPLELRNNILVNTSTPNGTGKTTVIRFGFVTIASFSALSNYNDLYAGIPGSSNLIFFDGTTGFQTLAAYKAYMTPRELQSVSTMPSFISTTSGSMNLHLQTNVATAAEAGGSIVSSPFAIVNDYDGDARYPETGYPVNALFPPKAPDMGADEIGGIPSDLIPPAINFTPFGNTFHNPVGGNARTLYVVITDGTGVPLSGTGLPMLYWDKNAFGYQGVQGTYVSGDTYSFTFGAGTTLGDVVSYYIVAQDLVSTPNVGAMPWEGTGFFTANPPATSMPPTNPCSYTILPGISGEFHVGIGKNYPTLTAAAADISTKILSGPVTLILDDPAYPAENYPVIFNGNTGSSAVNTLTIKPNTGVSPLLSGSVMNNGIIGLSGIDYLIIDGSNNGTNSRNLTIENTNTLSGANAILFMSNTDNDPSTNVIIRNCRIKSTPVHGSSSTNAPIRFSNAGGGYNNCTIENNLIIGGFDGIFLSGKTGSIIQNTRIINNMIGSYTDSEAITHNGVYIAYANNTLVEGNEIMGPYIGSLNVGQTGVYMGQSATATKIRKNRIHDFYHTADDGWGATGIWYSSDGSTVTEISNNSIYDIKAPGINPGVGQNIVYGIFVRSGGNVKILHNSINLTGPWLSTQYDASSACIGFYYQATGGNFEVRNNILRNGTVPTVLPGSSWGKAYGIMVSLNPSSMFTAIDNNDYYIDGYNGMIAQQYTNGLGTIVNYATLAEWQAYTGQEANSVTIDPAFTSPTNLLPTSTPLNNKGFYLTSVPTDITGKMRNNPSDIGAYEFGNDPFVYTLTKNSVTYNSAIVTGSANAAGGSVTTFFDYGTTTGYGLVATGTPSTIGGSVTTPMQSALTGLTYSTTYHYRARSVSNGNVTAYGVDSTFTTPAAPPSVITTSAGNISAVAATLNGSVNANNLATTITFEYGMTTSYGTVVAATPGTLTSTVATSVLSQLTGLMPNTTYHFRVIAVNSVGISYGNDMTFTTIAIAPLVVTNLAAVTAVTATLNGTVTANNAATTVTFEWGLTNAYGNTIGGAPATVNGMTPTPVTALLTNLTPNTTYHFRCKGVNLAGTIYGNDQTFTTNCIDPVITIAGPNIACAGYSNFIYTTQPGNSNYQWNVSPGGIITSGAGANAITVKWNTPGPQTVSVNYQNPLGCSALTPTTFTVTVNASPSPTVTGPVAVCMASTGNSYSTQAGMSAYTWTISAGGTITSGAGTNAITVAWNATGSQTVSVNYANASGCAAPLPTVYNVTVNPLPSPTITGPTGICANSGLQIYSTQTGFTGYNWSVSAGGSIVNGQGTSTVTVNWTAAGAQTISVNYANSFGCMAATPSVFNLTVNGPPAAAGPVSGISSVCAGMQGVGYSCTPISGTTYYVWTLPAGATIASGAGTTNITVDFAANATSGAITVAGNNLCGYGTASPAFQVTVNALPAAAGSITGPASVCQGATGVIYSVAAIANATSYQWVVPAGATIVSGTNTNQITVNFQGVPSSGEFIVHGINTCGNGQSSPALAVTVNTIPVAPVVTANGNILTSSAPAGNQWYYDNTGAISGATGQTYTVANNTGWYWCTVTLNGCTSPISNKVYVVVTGVPQLSAGPSVQIYPVPSNGKFSIAITSEKETVWQLEIFNAIGSKMFGIQEIRAAGTSVIPIDLGNVAGGVYTVVLRNTANQVVRKIIINN